MKTSRTLAACLLALSGLAASGGTAHAAHSTVWTLGTPDGEPSEFSSENGSSNSLPGSAAALDDDYYFAGTYPAPIGVRAGAEPVSHFERALTSYDPNDRIHFNLSAAQASATARYRITFRMLWGGWSGSGFGTHQIVVKMNGQTLATRTFTGDDTMTVQVNATAAAAVAGANRIEFSRVGGTAGAWIQFDYVKLEVDPTAASDADGDGLPLWWERDSGLSDQNASDATADSDGDGSTHAQEFARGTDPRLADSDGDGLKDGVETNTGTFVSAANTGTNPLVADTDGDSLLDGAEVALVPPASPLLVDTDGDGAPDAWEVRTGYSPANASSTPPAFPSAIGLKFVADVAPQDVFAPREVTGLVPQMNWNSTRLLTMWDTPSGSTADVATPTPGILVNSAGGATGMTVAWTSDNLWHTGNSGGPNQKLLDSYLAVWSANPASITLTGVPYPSYDVLVYVGANYQGPRGYVRLNNQTASDRYFRAGSTRPEAEFLEPVGSTAARPWKGNVIRFRNVTGTSCNVKLYRTAEDHVGIHAIQIVHATADSDGDGLPDWWEFTHQLRANFAGDAALDGDGDGLPNTAEFSRQTHPALADTDGDGLSDGVETATGTWVSATNTGSSPRLADTDGDGVNDGREVNALPAATNPNLADTDGDGRSDAEELSAGTDPLTTTPATANIPVITASPRTFLWEINNVQLVWDHGRGHAANNEWTEDYLFTAWVNNRGTGQGNALKVGIRVRDGRLTHFLYSNHQSAFSSPGAPDSDIWESDWSAAADKRAAMGFSGYGRVDISDRLRFRVTGSSPGSQNQWTMTFELRNLDTNQVVSTVTFPNCTLAANVHGNTAIWENDAGEQNRPNFWEHTGVEAYLRATPLENLPAFAAHKDTDEDGMPDAWEDARGLNKNSAADAALDPDGDAATNLREYLAGTNPQDADSDDDGVRDGAELTGGSDPLLASSRPAYFHGLPAGLNGEDLNGNGLPDAWEQWVGSFSLAPNADRDGDGFSDASEALAGTNALDPRSRLWAAVERSGNHLVLRWPRLLHKRHEVWQSPNLVSWTLAGGAPVANGSEFQQTFPNGLSGPNRFFKPGIGNLDTDADGVSDWTEATVLASSATSANSLRAALPIDTNSDGTPDTTVSGDYAALVERMQGASVSGGFPGGSGGAVSRSQAARFLMQASFGPTLADIERVQQLGYAAWITEQVAKPATLHSTYIRGIFADFAGPRADLTYNYSEMDQFLYGNNLPTAFARAAMQGEDQLRQRVAFALSQILVTSLRDANLENRALGMADYYDIFVRHAFGSYRDVLQEVALHPCMGRYLSHVGNQKADPSINRFPDENFAREVMQLFSVGLWELNADGTRQVNGLGQHIPTYTNAEITQMARVFTGLWFGGYGWGDGGWTEESMATPMTMHADRHDFGEKVLLGGFVIPERTPSDENGLRDVSDALRHLFEHANTGPFIGRQLIQFLVTDNPSPAYVARVSAVFANNGSGVRGDLGAVVRAILLDEEARDPRYAANTASFGKLREPVIRAMALGRAFGMKNVPGLLWWDWGEFFADARQSPMNSPSVFNFYRPDYRAPGLLTQHQLAGPVFQITDSYSAIAFPNRLWDLIEDGFSLWDTYRFPLDLSAATTLAATPELLVDHVNLLLCAGQMSASTRGIVLNAVNTIPATQPEARARIAAYLACVAAEGAVLK